uniref:Metalloendopeptidase n=1 Tax=Globodera pallida TaxID=36090 RepID=A0A183CKW5_GLOPA
MAGMRLNYGFGLVSETCPAQTVGCRIRIQRNAITFYEYLDRNQFVCVLKGEFGEQFGSGCIRKRSGSIRCWCFGRSNCNSPEHSKLLYEAFVSGNEQKLTKTTSASTTKMSFTHTSSTFLPPIPGKSPEQVKQEVRVRMTKTQQLKKALLLNAGLEGQVEPADNGVFGHDQLLTEGQANELINELARQRSNRGKRAGNAMFLEPTSTKRWDPNKAIPYMFDQSLAEADKKAVREAVTEIQSKTCLNFTEVHAKPTGSHLYYTKIANPTFCGLSYVGRVEPANPIYLSFMCGHPAGVAIHETMHALGFQHEQLRYDRDQFITIQWENVNPQQLDFFTVSDVTKFSSYGIKYDYGSIMQYSSTIASSSPGKKTMVAKLKPAENDVLLGQRVGMAQSDVEAVKKLYCQSGCDDKIVFCGIWATMNLCDARMWRRAVVHAWIMSNCQKSCNKCGEKLETVDGRPF